MDGMTPIEMMSSKKDERVTLPCLVGLASLKLGTDVTKPVDEGAILTILGGLDSDLEQLVIRVRRGVLNDGFEPV